MCVWFYVLEHMGGVEPPKRPSMLVSFSEHQDNSLAV